MKNKLAQKDEFSEVLRLIHEGRNRGFHAVNVALIETYWSVGECLSRKVAESGWGKGVVKELALWLLRKAPDIKGFSASNLWRMKQFYETYSGNEKLAPLVLELSWTNNLLILAQCKTIEEQIFYVHNSAQANWTKRELQNQINRGTFERTMLTDQKLAAQPRVLSQSAEGVFKDLYLLDFLNLSDPHTESDLQTALVQNLRKFLLELGHGFTFVGEKVRLQVGNTDHKT